MDWVRPSHAYTVHKPENCKLGKEQSKNKQNIVPKAAIQQETGDKYIKALLASITQQDNK